MNEVESITSTLETIQTEMHETMRAPENQPRLEAFEKMFRTYMSGTRKKESARSLYNVSKEQAATIRRAVRDDLGQKQPLKKRKAKAATKPVQPKMRSNIKPAADSTIVHDAMRALLRERYNATITARLAYADSIKACKQMGVSFETPAPE